MRTNRRRVLALERFQRPARTVYVWNDYDDKTQAKVEAIRREHGDAVKVMLIGWLREQGDAVPEHGTEP